MVAVKGLLIKGFRSEKGREGGRERERDRETEKQRGREGRAGREGRRGETGRESGDVKVRASGKGEGAEGASSGRVCVCLEPQAGGAHV